MKKLILVSLTLLALLGAAQPAFAKSADSKGTHRSAMATKVAKVNLNTAGAKELAEVLTGIGIKKAHAIVSYRKTNGKFKSIEDLAKVKGIGVSTISRNHGRIVI